MTAQAARRACLVAGCGCRDARIVSTRRAAFVRATRPDATPTRDNLEPLPPEWPTWPDRPLQLSRTGAWSEASWSPSVLDEERRRLADVRRQVEDRIARESREERP